MCVLVETGVDASCSRCVVVVVAGAAGGGGGTRRRAATMGRHGTTRIFIGLLVGGLGKERNREDASVCPVCAYSVHTACVF